MKWKELPYDESSWEAENEISTFQSEIEKFHKIQSRSGKSSRQKISILDGDELRKQKEFQQYEHSPEFLSGGINYLRHLHVLWFE